jgi:predicted ArsR family transcriptional regulator
MHDGKTMDNCEKILSLLQENRKGISIENVVERLKIDRSTVYRHLESLDLQGKARYEKGVAYPVMQETDPPGIAEKYFQWRGTPVGGGVRFYKFIFPEKSEHTKKKQ